jgi:hypothetical protein
MLGAGSEAGSWAGGWKLIWRLEAEGPGARGCDSQPVSRKVKRSVDWSGQGGQGGQEAGKAEVAREALVAKRPGGQRLETAGPGARGRTLRGPLG